MTKELTPGSKIGQFDQMTTEISGAAKTKAEKKDDTFWKILNAAISLDFKKGHQKWTLSELSRTTGITRSLIYYYFGRDRLSILNEALRFLGEEFFGLTPARLKMWSEGQVGEAALATRRALEQSPQLQAFYLAHRFKQTPLGETIRKLEDQYANKLKRFFPKLSNDEIRGLYAVMFGVVFAPALTDGAVKEAVKMALLISHKRSGKIKTP